MTLLSINFISTEVIRVCETLSNNSRSQLYESSPRVVIEDTGGKIVVANVLFI